MKIKDCHPSIALASDLNTLCTPLKKININYFHFARFYSNSTAIGVASNSACHKHVFSNECPAGTNLALLGEGYYLWKDIYDLKLLADAKESFGITQGILKLKMKENYYDVYAFAGKSFSSKEESILLYQKEVLESFSSYFDDAGSGLIALCESDPIALPDAMLTKVKSANEVFNMTSLEDFYSDINNFYYPLSKREIECLVLYVKGHSSREVADLLFLSPRTIEKHIDRIKNKLSVSKRSELFAFVAKTPLVNLLSK